MLVVLNHDVNRVKNGVAARSRDLGLSAHGQSPELARRNLERLVLLYLRPFQREGTLDQEIARAGLQADNEEPGLRVTAV
jgi:hypothetical protein